MRVARLSSRILAAAGIDTATALKLGGIASGANVSFFEPCEGFAKVIALDLAKVPAARKHHGKCGMKRRGPKLWAEFHPWTLTDAARDPVAAALWLDDFQSRLRCDECEAEFAGLRTLFDCADPFGSGVLIHNRVNRKLGKADMAVDEALKRTATSPWPIVPGETRPAIPFVLPSPFCISSFLT